MVAEKTLDKLSKLGFTLVECDLDSLSMLSTDICRPIIAFEAPRSIRDYLQR